MSTEPFSGLQLERLGTLMQPELGNPLEADGVLNPAAARGRDGQLYIFPRMVAEGNFSRIGISRVLFDKAGDPRGVERMGIALEPEADYELRPDGGGCEDPRISFVEPLGQYIMSYTAYSPKGPRIALATSGDLFEWNRLGLATFEPYDGIEFDGIDNKDASIFPAAIPDPSGTPALAILHRPLFPGTRPEEKAKGARFDPQNLHRESIWISYRDIDPQGQEPIRPCHFTSHHRLAAPAAPWEQLKIGGGTPPVLTNHGWLIAYHGVSDAAGPDEEGTHLCYSAGVMILSAQHPQVIRYRSSQPVLTPELPEERVGYVADVVFPTGIDRRNDLGMPDRLDVYYGMADDRIGVARLDLPEQLPTGEVQNTGM